MQKNSDRPLATDGRTIALNSQLERRMARVAKPARVRKPYPDFPLTPHPSGRSCKEAKGRFYCFGRAKSDPKGTVALSESGATAKSVFSRETK